MERTEAQQKATARWIKAAARSRLAREGRVLDEEGYDRAQERGDSPSASPRPKHVTGPPVPFKVPPAHRAPGRNEAR